MGPDEENKRNTMMKSQTHPSPKQDTIDKSTNIKLKQQPELVIASTLPPSTLPSYTFGVEAKTPIGLGDTLIEKTNKEVDLTLPFTTSKLRNTMPMVIEPNMVNQNHEIKDMDVSGNTAITQKTATESNMIDVEPKGNSRIDDSHITWMQINRETINVPL
jgi:hypothetical protein